MKESIVIFLRDFLSPSYAIVFFASIFYYKKYSHTVLKHLPFIFLTTLLLETFSGYFASINNNNNLILFNFYDLIFYPFYFFTLFNYLDNEKYKKIIIAFFIIFCITAIINVYLQDFLSEFQLLTNSAGAILLIVSLILYFVETLNSNKVLTLQNNLMFWVSIGLLIFHVGATPILLIRSLILPNYVGETMLNLYIVQLILIYIMNLLFITGFICAKKNS